MLFENMPVPEDALVRVRGVLKKNKEKMLFLRAAHASTDCLAGYDDVLIDIARRRRRERQEGGPR